jgi:Ca-activated chloride channel family protein
MDFRLAQPEALWGLIPLSLFIIYLLWRCLFRRPWFSWRRFWLTFLGFLFFICALARPQGGSFQGEPEPLASTVLVALDISNSMLTEDITPSRLGFSISFIRRLIEGLARPRLAIYPFAASGFLQMPFTTDIYAIQDSLQSLDPSATSHQGTDFNESLAGLDQLLLKLEANSRDQLEGWQPPKIILFSDGESHVPLRKDTLKPFQQRRIPVFTVGVGTPEGAQIPLKTLPGKEVVSKLDPAPLQTIAAETGGAYFSSNYENIPILLNQLNHTLTLGKRNRQFKVQSELFPFLFILSLLFFFWEFCFGRWQYVIRTFIFCLALSHATTIYADDDQIKAIQTYNKGIEQSELNNFEKAAEYFEESSLVLQDSSQRKKALYNLGNAFLKMGDPEQALESYQKAFRVSSSNPDFEESANKNISENMALASKILEEMKKQSKPQGADEQGDGDQDKGTDPKGPQKYQGESLTEQQKQKLYDLITSEEKQTMKRLREQNQPPQSLGMQPW